VINQSDILFVVDANGRQKRQASCVTTSECRYDFSCPRKYWIILGQRCCCVRCSWKGYLVRIGNTWYVHYVRYCYRHCYCK